MQWTRTVFDARAIERARQLKKLRAFFVARADGHIVSGRSKSRYPGASPCAMGQRQLSRLARGRAARSPPSGDAPKGRSPGVFAKQAVKTIACGTPDDAA